MCVCDSVCAHTHTHTHQTLGSDERRSQFNIILLSCPQAQLQSEPAADKLSAISSPSIPQKRTHFFTLQRHRGITLEGTGQESRGHKHTNKHAYSHSHTQTQHFTSKKNRTHTEMIPANPVEDLRMTEIELLMAAAEDEGNGGMEQCWKG